MELDGMFSTRDIYLAATLICLHFYVANIDYQVEGKSPRPVGYFQFEATPELQKAEKAFWQGKLAVEPRQFVTNFRGLYSQVNDKYKSPYSKFNTK